MPIRRTRSSGRWRSAVHVGRRLSALLGVLAVIALLAAPQAQAAPTPPGAPGGGSFIFYNMVTSQCMDLPDYGNVGWNTPIAQYWCNSSNTRDNQGWWADYTRSVGTTDLFTFHNVKSGLCLDLPNYGADPAGTRLETYPCASDSSSDNQEWYFTVVTPDSSGHPVVLIRNFKSNGLCLDVSGWSSDGSDRAADLPLTIYDCSNPGWWNSGYDDHLWRLYPTTA